MATDREQKILEAFLAVAGDARRGADRTPGLSGLEDEAAENSPQAATTTDKAPTEAQASGLVAGMATSKAQTEVPASQQVATISRSKAQTEVLTSYAGLLQNSPVYSLATAAGGQGSTGGVLKTVFGTALGMVPLARLVMGLFGGGDEEEPAALTKYALPAKMRIDAANGPGGSLTGVDYGQSGLPRVYGQRERGGVQAEGPAAPGGGTRSAEASGSAEQAGRDGGSGTATQVTIQVQAMDSKSFMDHKEDIARAVREAMLNMSPLNDVVSEL